MAKARRSESPRNRLAFPGFTTGEQGIGPEGSAPREEVFMPGKPFAGREGRRENRARFLDLNPAILGLKRSSVQT
jgi:hypothetical protein